MPRFLVEAQYEDDEEKVSLEREFSLDDEEFRSQLLDVKDALLAAKDQLASIKTITAAEDVSDDVKTGDVVWRDWADCDLMSTEGRKQAIALALGAKTLWLDPGFGFDLFCEMLCPEEWEVREYGLTADDGYILPEN